METIDPNIKVIDNQARNEVWKVATDQHLIAYILKDLEKVVKKDVPTKISCLITCLSAYTSDPLVTSLRGPSGVGKTHNVMAVSKYFPKEDVWILGGLSPKSLIHERGILMDEDDQPILLGNRPQKPMRRRFPSGERGGREYDEALEQYRRDIITWNERLGSSHRLINLDNKILIFLESPSLDTIRMLLPILSHDSRRIEYKYFEELETKTAIIEGWPAVIFLSTDSSYMEELATRNLAVTPESGSDKIREANELTNVQASFPWEFEGERESALMVRKVVSFVKEKLVNGKFGIVVPFENLHEIFPREITRDMRDFKHFVRFLETLAAIHVSQRPVLKIGEKCYILATVDDVILALCTYSKIFETTRTGTDENILRFYHEIVKSDSAWQKRDLSTSIIVGTRRR